MGYYELAREAREELSRSTDTAAKGTWAQRLRELGVLTANLLVEMGDLECAAEHLASLPAYDAGDPEDPDSQRLRTMEAFVWIRVGDIAAARRSLADSTTVPLTPIHALLKMADDDFEGATKTWEDLRKANVEDPMVAQNLAVCLLYQGQLAKARDVLESLIASGHSFHSLTFNLATLYELSTERAKDKKLHLAERLAAQTPSADEGWEKAAVDFKL